ncbi:MAG: hypothetical protein RRY65_05745 [Pseudoflavonifractor sp.]
MSWLQKLMYGRYGGDHLSLGLLVAYLLLSLLANLLDWAWLSWLALVPVAFALLRMFSKNVPKRRAENAKFMTLVEPGLRWFKMRRTIHRDKEHAYFKCPNCGQYLRVPKGKGKLTVTCRSCGVSFEEKS